jgi:transcriptional regulator with XRE-family HTH domain
MDMWDLKKWRRKLRYSQFEAAEKLGVSRGAIQHWECERNPIPNAIDLACEEIARRWKQRPEFGPVVLVYSDEPMWPEPDCPSRVLCMQCELHPNNEAAIWRACRLRKTPNVINPFVMGEDGGIVLTNPELLNECDKRREIDKNQ